MLAVDKRDQGCNQAVINSRHYWELQLNNWILNYEWEEKD